jgi:hypothetical protein
MHLSYRKVGKCPLEGLSPLTGPFVPNERLIFGGQGIGYFLFDSISYE